jgi:hypothetical protein
MWNGTERRAGGADDDGGSKEWQQLVAGKDNWRYGTKKMKK